MKVKDLVDLYLNSYTTFSEFSDLLGGTGEKERNS
jgi:hypothetical protein